MRGGFLTKGSAQRLFVLVFVLSVGLGYSRGWSYLLASEAGIDMVYLGLMETASIVVALLLRYPIGVMIDIVGPKKFILSGCIFSAVASLMYLWSIGPATFLTASALESLSLLVIHVSLFSTALAILPEKQKGLFFSRYNIADQSGGIVLPLLAGFLAAIFGLRLLFKIDFVASVFMLLIFALFFPSTKRKPHQTFKSALSRLYDLRQAAKKVLVLVIAIEFFLGASVGLFSAYLAVYAEKVLGMDYQIIGIVFSLSVLAFVVSSYKMGKVIDMWGPVKSWMFSSVLYGFLLVSFAFSGSMWLFIAIYCLTMVAQSIQIPAYQSLLPYILPKGREGQITGLVGNAMKISTLLVAPLGAILWKPFDPKMIFVFSGILMCLSTIPCCLFLMKTSLSENSSVEVWT